MDPDQAWKDLAEAIEEDDWPKAEEQAYNLIRWIEDGGFPPTVTGKEAFDAILVRDACSAVLSWEVA